MGTIVLPQELLYSKLSCSTSGQHFWQQLQVLCSCLSLKVMLWTAHLAESTLFFRGNSCHFLTVVQWGWMWRHLWIFWPFAQLGSLDGRDWSFTALSSIYSDGICISFSPTATPDCICYCTVQSVNLAQQFTSPPTVCPYFWICWNIVSSLFLMKRACVTFRGQRRK